MIPGATDVTSRNFNSFFRIVPFLTHFPCIADIFQLESSPMIFIAINFYHEFQVKKRKRCAKTDVTQKRHHFQQNIFVIILWSDVNIKIFLLWMTKINMHWICYSRKNRIEKLLQERGGVVFSSNGRNTFGHYNFNQFPAAFIISNFHHF